MSPIEPGPRFLIEAGIWPPEDRDQLIKRIEEEEIPAHKALINSASDLIDRIAATDDNGNPTTGWLENTDPQTEGLRIYYALTKMDEESNAMELCIKAIKDSQNDDGQTIEAERSIATINVPVVYGAEGLQYDDIGVRDAANAASYFSPALDSKDQFFQDINHTVDLMWEVAERQGLLQQIAA